VSVHQTEFQGSVTEALAQAITTAIPDAHVEVNGGGGHYTIEVTSAVFAGKGMLESQRLVYSAITHLMTGANPPVHAVDSLKTRVPAAT
jgi:acid stress-induced BolA-like protein IbaG/YrbA